MIGRYLTTAQAAAYCGFKTPSAIRKAKQLGLLIPAGQRAGGRTNVYRREDLDAFMVGRASGSVGWVPGKPGRVKLAPPEPSFVYFIGHSSAVKIGVTIDVERRLRMLQIGSAEPLRLLATMAGVHRDERRLHRRFAHLRLTGEWFRADPELLSFIDEITRR
jgi:hypothetical protein